MPAPAKSREAPDGSDPRMVGRRPSLARRRHAAGAAPDHARGRGRPALHRAGYVRELLGRDPAGGDGPRREARRLREDLQAGGGVPRAPAGKARPSCPPFAFVNAFLARHPLLRRLLLPAAGLIAFALFLVLTFPYDVLARRIEIEAQRAGAELSIGSVGAGGLASVRARDVRVRLAPAGSVPWPELRFDRAVFSPDVLAMLFRRTSFGFSVQGYVGTPTGHIALSKDPRLPGVSSLRLDAVDLDLAALPLREMAGVSVAGKLRVKAELPALLPVETAQGAVTIALDGAALMGGVVMGLSLPRTTFGRIDGSVAVEKGDARIDKTAARGGDLEADVDGNVTLRPLLSLSQADLHVRFRAAGHWLDENSVIKGMMGLIQNARQGDGSYVFTFTGPLSRLQPRPGR